MKLIRKRKPSLKTVLGVTKVKRSISKATGIPTTKSGRKRKAMNTLTNGAYGKYERTRAAINRPYNTIKRPPTVLGLSPVEEKQYRHDTVNGKDSAMKKRSGCCLGSCFGSLIKLVLGCVCLFVAMVFVGVLSSPDDSLDSSTATKQPTVATATAAPTADPTPVATIEAPGITQTEEHSEILLTWPELGEYGKYYTFNENVKKAEESDKETIIQCFVPAGDYIVTNVNHSPWTYVYAYSAKTVITSNGWEEPAETWVSPQLKPGDSCEVTISEGWYINLQEKDVFKLVRK